MRRDRVRSIYIKIKKNHYIEIPLSPGTHIFRPLLNRYVVLDFDKEESFILIKFNRLKGLQQIQGYIRKTGTQIFKICVAGERTQFKGKQARLKAETRAGRLALRPVE